MRIVVLDFESFYSDDYTLSKMSTEAYIRDPRFEAHGAAVKWSPDQPAVWYDEPQLRQVLKQQDWSDVLLVHHHAQFDGFILSHHYNVHPRLFGCTLSMARLLLGNHLSVSLDSVRKHFGMPLKTTPYNLFKGKHWNEMHPSVQQQVAVGACDEVESIWQLFQILGKDFPQEEYEVVDSVVKMFTQPVLVGDLDVLGKIWVDEATKKEQRLRELNVTEAELQSADRFAQLLRDEGVEPEKKTSPKGKEIYAFAKTDNFMRDLQEHDNERVQALAEGRLGVKSTIMQTRAETLGWMARRGSLCVYLRYAGAGTLRPSGGDSTNFLNLKRRSPIRKSIKSPEGYLLGPVDSSQLECRILHYLAGGPDEPVIQKFRAGEDPYTDLSSQFYGEKIYKPKNDDPRKDEMEAKRGVGKQGRLMCGFGASGKQFKITAKNGLYGPPVEISLDDANNFVSLYRSTNPSICAPHVGYWAQANKMIARLAGGEPTQWGPLLVKDHRIYIQGRPMIYDTMEFYIPEAGEECRDFERDGWWRVKTRNGWKKMWGSKLVQNICEGVETVIASQAMTRLKHLGYRTLNWPYDELLLLIPNDGRLEQHQEIILRELRRTPDWLPGLPLDAEISVAEVYSK